MKTRVKTLPPVLCLFLGFGLFVAGSSEAALSQIALWDSAFIYSLGSNEIRGNSAGVAGSGVRTIDFDPHGVEGRILPVPAGDIHLVAPEFRIIEILDQPLGEEGAALYTSGGSLSGSLNLQIVPSSASQKQVPIPAAVWLGGPGMLFLAALRRISGIETDARKDGR